MMMGTDGLKRLDDLALGTPFLPAATARKMS
jgi:hypothetical protein